MIEVLLGTGIRLGELAALDMDDIDLDAKHLRVRAKGNVPQVKFIKTDLRTLLRRYLAKRRRHGRQGMEALFLSNRDGRLCQRQIANRLAHWLRKAGIEKELTPQGLRHVRVVEPQRAGTPGLRPVDNFDKTLGDLAPGIPNNSLENC
ncbi:MAG: tyrosine-type recombinase/integrase [Thermodesulfobacteriota bacterium]|nr:tyrosine-type recombinase/integrase [Thermodesulfobacteriota bacterium]